MIIAHQKFELSGKPLIEKLIIQTPFRFNADFQNEGCLIYFLQGAPKVVSALETEHLKSRESVLLKCGGYIADLLKDSTTDRYEVVVIHLHHDVLKRIYEERAPKFLKGGSNSSITKVNSNIAIQKYIESIYFYFENPALVDDDLLELKVKELILLLLKCNVVDSLSDLFSYLFTAREIALKDLVQTHLFSPLSVGDMASLASMSLSTFNRAFQLIFNEPPASYLKTKRLERAAEYLFTTNKPVSEIAYDTGFNDLAHFSRSFKSQFKLSPSGYRLAFKRNPLK